MKRFLFFTFLFFLVTVIACSSKKSAKAFHTVLYGEIEYLDPTLSSDENSREVIINLFEGLLELHPKTLEPRPALAKKFEVSDDGLTYSFYLRDDAKWSNGDAVTANDFVYSWRRAVDPKTAAKYAYYLYHLKNGEAINTGKISDLTQLGVSAISPTILKAELEHPLPFFPYLVSWTTFLPVHQKTVETYDKEWAQPGHIVTNGPFLLKEWKPYDQILLEANPNYWDRKHVHLTQAVFHVIEEAETALKLFQEGTLHFMHRVPDLKIKTLKSQPEFVDGPLLGTYFVMFNVNTPQLKDKRVRQAFVMAIDRQKIVDVIQKGMASASFVPESIAGYIPAKGLEFNPEKARAQLAEAGFADPKKFPETTLVYNTSDEHKMAMQLIQNMWKENLGIEVKLYNMEMKSLLKEWRVGNFQISRRGWIGDYPDPTTFLDLFRPGFGNNFSGWNHQGYEELLREATKTRNASKRFQLLRKAESILLDESPALPIYTYTHPHLISAKVTGIYHNAMNQHPLKGVTLD